MRSWNPDGRPVPVTTAQAARSALRTQGEVALVVDVAGPVRFVVEGGDLVRLADGWALARAGTAPPGFAEHGMIEQHQALTDPVPSYPSTAPITQAEACDCLPPASAALLQVVGSGPRGSGLDV